MGDWMHDLPIGWMALVVFTLTYLVAGAILAITFSLARGERARVFSGVSPAMLSPLGVIFGLMVVFMAAQVWGDIDRAKTAVNREASSIRMVTLLARSFPGEPEARIRSLIRRHVEESVSLEWPSMAEQSASLKVAAPALSEALQVVLALEPKSEGQIAAQREMVAELVNGMDARRQRIITSRSSVNWVKWSCMFGLAVCMLVAVTAVHWENRGAATLATGIFATGVALSVLLILSHDRPFSGVIAVTPDVLRQAMPD
jgi:hypothetical protein